MCIRDRDRNEHVRRESASFGIFPAGERFHAAELPCQGADDRLVENPERGRLTPDMFVPVLEDAKMCIRDSVNTAK